MKVEIIPNDLNGNIEAIASKSDVHRILICAALADSETEILLSGSMGADTLSQDILATINCLKALGADIYTNNTDSGKTAIIVTPIKTVPNNPILDCGESGSTLRFILPVAAALLTRNNSSNDNEITITGKGRLPDRPIGELKDVLENSGINFSSSKLPFTISGVFKPDIIEITGNVSSQYITGLLLGLSAVESFRGQTKIKITSALQSASYIDITINAMEKFGVKIEKTVENGLTCFIISGTDIKNATGQIKFTSPGTICADGDWSNAAFFLALKNLGHDVTISSLNNDSPQGDKAIVELLEVLATKANKSFFFTSKGERTISLRETPDLLPIMAVVAAFSQGTTHFTDAERLRTKESDRLSSVCDLITKLGGKAEEQPAGLIVYPQPLLGGTIDSYNDHRIVMAAAIAAANCISPVLITNAEAVNKSYPTFFDDYKRLGGNINVI